MRLAVGFGAVLLVGYIDYASSLSTHSSSADVAGSSNNKEPLLKAEAGTTMLPSISTFASSFLWKRKQTTKQLKVAQSSPSLGTSSPKVVFMGDSITEYWQLEKSFPKKGNVNKGVSGQITSEMLHRFSTDVIDLHPEVVVILGGTNDIARDDAGTPLSSFRMTQQSMRSMVKSAHENGIRVVLCRSLLLATIRE